MIKSRNKLRLEERANCTDMKYLLDTNIYRELFGEDDDDKNLKKIRQIKSILESNNDTLLVSAIVLEELVRRLVPGDSAQAKCFKSLKALFSLHGTSIHPIPDYRDIISLFLGKTIEMNMGLYDFCFQISKLDSVTCISEEQLSTILKVKDLRDRELLNIIENIKEYFLSEFSTDQFDWRAISANKNEKATFDKFLEMGLLHNLLSMAYLKDLFGCTENIPEEIRSKFMNYFCVTLDFMVDNVIRKISTIGKPENFWNINTPRARNTWNSHFDAQLILACEYQNNFDMETDTIFVTMEKNKIIQTFEKNGKSKFVMHLEEFKEKFNV